MDASESQPATRAPAAPTRAALAVSAGVAALAFAAYALTAPRTITWWEGSSYPLAARTLGVTPAPGSLVLTLLGWAVSRVPLVFPVAFRLNLFAAVIAALLAGLVTGLTIRLAAPADRSPRAPELAAGAIAGLAFAFGTSVWTHAARFTPYVLSACFTALILAAALAWWRGAAVSDRRGRLFLLFLLFGLDFSVHRTNALFLPAALAWVALRRPRAWLDLRSWGALAGGLAVGLAFHLLLIPLSARDPALNIGEPRDLARLWSYVSLEQYGGGFLVRMFPRSADFLGVQLADYLGFLRANLLPAWPWLPLPALLAALGWVATLRDAPRRGLGLLLFLLCGSLGAVLYFNLPKAYFRTMERHYLPSLVVLAPLVGVGASTVLRLAARFPGAPGRGLALAMGAALAWMPLASLAKNLRACDQSRVRFAETYSRDVLEPLPERAILLTNGDNDSFPLWYLQQVEGVRPDVAVINIPLTNTAWYPRQLGRRHPDLAGLGERAAPAPGPGDSSVAIPVDPGARVGVPPSVPLPDTVRLRLTPSEPGSYLIPQDYVILDLLRLNRWRRPVCLAVTVPPSNLSWLWPWARLDGMAFRVLPTKDAGAWDLEHLRHVLTERVRYAGVADTSVLLESASRAMTANYAAALFQLASAQLERGDPHGCLDTLRFLEERVPPGRFGEGSEALRASLRELETRAKTMAAGAAVR